VQSVLSGKPFLQRRCHAGVYPATIVAFHFLFLIKKYFRGACVLARRKFFWVVAGTPSG
jgi:hypothetical protein